MTSSYPELRACVRESLDNASSDGGYPAELAELSDEAQAEDLIDKTDAADMLDASAINAELLLQVTTCVAEWRAELPASLRVIDGGKS